MRLKNYGEGFSILEALVATAVSSVALVGFSGLMMLLAQQSTISNEWFSIDRSVVDVSNDVLYFPDDYRLITGSWISCSLIGSSPAFETVSSRCSSLLTPSRDALFEFRSVNTDQGLNLVQLRVLELKVIKQNRLVTIFLPPEHVEFSFLNKENYPERGYRIKSWHGSTAERFKGRYFGVLSLPQYTIYRTRDWREMVAEMAKVQPKYVDGSPMSLVCSPGTSTCTRGDAFTIVCDSRVGPCAMYESSPALIEYISKGDCGPPCM